MSAKNMAMALTSLSRILMTRASRVTYFLMSLGMYWGLNYMMIIFRNTPHHAARKQIMEHDLGCLENINQYIQLNKTDQRPVDEMKRRNLYNLLSPFLSVKNLKNFF